MTISWLSLFWLFFFYSFIGWCIEVCSAAVQHRKFVNRGFVAGPLCPIYGFGAMLFEIFLPELTEYPFFLFLGGFVLSSLLEYSTGMFFEKVYKKKLWDYSRFRYNVGGYICLPFSLLWGALSVVTVMFADPLLCGLFAEGLAAPLAGSLVFAASPILLERAFRHTSLGAQWLVLAALYCYFVCRRQSRFASRGLFVINILAVGIHPYFLPMTYAVTLALLLEYAVTHKRWAGPAVFLGCDLACTAVLGWALGLLYGTATSGGQALYEIGRAHV